MLEIYNHQDNLPDIKVHLKLLGKFMIPSFAPSNFSIFAFNPIAG